MTKTMPTLLLTLLVGCAGPQGNTGAAPVARMSPAQIIALGRMPEAEEVYRDQIVLAGRRVPLPPGEWVATWIVGRVEGTGEVTTGVVMLVQRSGPTLRAVLSIGTSGIGRFRPGMLPVAGPCAATDVIAGDVRAASDKDHQDCVVIGFADQAAERASKGVAWQTIDKLNLVPPPIFIRGNTRLSTPDGYVWTDYSANPDLDGVPVDNEPNRALNGWSRDRLARDPAKRAYVDRLHAFLEGYRVRLLQALQQAEPVPVKLPPGVIAPGGVSGGKLET